MINITGYGACRAEGNGSLRTSMMMNLFTMLCNKCLYYAQQHFHNYLIYYYYQHLNVTALTVGYELWHLTCINAAVTTTPDKAR